MAPSPWFPPTFDVAHWTIGGAGRDPASNHHVDAVLAALAEHQHGVVSARQLLALGVSRDQLHARLRSGHLHRVRPGVYAVGYARITPAGARMAAVLACGDGARLAGWSGATQRGLLPDSVHAIDVAVPLAKRVRRTGLTLRRTDARPDEITLADGIPTHTVPRLLVDIALRNGEEVLEWAWRQAIFHKQLDIAAVGRLLGERDGHPGTPAVRALYERRAAMVGELRSRFELLMLPIIREAGLPEPLCNIPWEVAPGVVLRPDFRVPQLQLVIEADGRDGHADVEFLLDDEERDALYAAHGHRTLRYGWWEARRERSRVIAELRACVARAA